MSTIQVLSEFWAFIRFNKKYWLLPILAVLVLAGLSIEASQGSRLSPQTSYMLF